MLSGAFLFLEMRVWAEELTFQAEVNKSSIAVNATFTYKLIVTSSQSRIPEPKFPKFSGFTILSQANTSKISVEQGKVKIYQSYIFMLAPIRPGTFTINSAELTIGGKTYSSAEFKIKVDPVKPQPQTSAPGEQTPPEKESSILPKQLEVTL